MSFYLPEAKLMPNDGFIKLNDAYVKYKSIYNQR